MGLVQGQLGLRRDSRGNRGAKSRWRLAYLAGERLKLQRYFDYNFRQTGQCAPVWQARRISYVLDIGQASGHDAVGKVQRGM